MEIFIELSIIIVVATVIAGLMRLFKQPLIMGHILTGLIVGPQALDLIHSLDTMETFSKIGISILLFIVGLGLSPKIIKDVGKIAVITGLGQIIFTTIFGFLLAKLFGYETLHALFIAIALTFSSTIIILKLLSDKKDSEKLYGRIAIGFLLVQDLVATIILLVISAFSNNQNATTTALLAGGKGLILTVALVFISAKILPKLSNFFAESQEFLFLFSIGWGLGMAALFNYIGFSVEIGALIAGVTLSVSPYSQEISAKLKPLRDFFIIMFFVSLGTKLVIQDVKPLLFQSFVLSLFVLIGNPLIVMALMGTSKYKRKTSFLAGLTVAQISEFSLILILLGVEYGYVTSQILSLITIVGLVTIAIATYLIMYAEKIYPHIAKYLLVFERKAPIEETDILGSYEVILFGANRVGYDFLKLFKKLGQSFLVIDFDPEVIRGLRNEGVNCRYGDAEDADFLEDLNLGESKLVVSTIPDFETNSFLLNKVRSLSKDVIIILISYNIDEALKHYKDGATYVILPHFIGGHFAAMLATEHWLHIDTFNLERDKHINYLEERKRLGHKHPKN